MSSQIATPNQFDEHALQVTRGERFEFGKNWMINMTTCGGSVGRNEFVFRRPRLHTHG